MRVTGRGSDVLTEALARYEEVLEETPPYTPSTVPGLQRLNQVHDHITLLSVHVAFSDQSLNLATDESYELQVDAPESKIVANTVWGALRGLETFSQAVDRIQVPHDVAVAAGVDPLLLHETTNGADELGWLRRPLWHLLEAFQGALGHHHHHRHKHHHRHHKHHRRHRKHHRKHHKKHHKHGQGSKSFWIINATVVRDAPRFHHRGLLIDTARHFLPVSVIMGQLDAMEQAKLNVLHWHLVDDQSFPLQSAAVPSLSLEGAFAVEAVYSPQDVAAVVAYAHARGIRIIPEIDTPGHTRSWGRGDLRLLTECHDERGQPTGEVGPLDPTRQHTYTVLWRVLQEVSAHFPDSYMHLGGDEVSLNCWQNNPGVQAFMKDHNMSDVKQLEQHYILRLLNLTKRTGRSYIVWQEVLDNDIEISNDTIVQVWKDWWPVTSMHEGQQARSLAQLAGNSGVQSLDLPQAARGHGTGARSAAYVAPSVLSGGLCHLSTGCRRPQLGRDSKGDKSPGYAKELAAITAKGYRALLSAPWYLNNGMEGAPNWAAYHAVEPLDFKGNDTQKALVVGGEAAMWGEFTDASNALSKTWPDAAAVAERLWSPPAKGRPAQKPVEAERRLKEHRCRMLARGGRASPLGPGYCPADPAYDVAMHGRDPANL